MFLLSISDRRGECGSKVPLNIYEYDGYWLEVCLLADSKSMYLSMGSPQPLCALLSFLGTWSQHIYEAYPTLYH